ASRNAGELVENALSLHAHGAARVAAAQDSDGVERHVRLFQELPQFVEGVPGIVILTVTNQQESALRVCSTLHFFDAEIAGVVQGSLAFRLDERELVQDRVAVAGSVEQ